MLEISELEEKLRQSQKKLNDLQYEVNAIHMELLKLKEGEQPVQTKTEPIQSVQPVQSVQPAQPVKQGVQTAQPVNQQQGQPAPQSQGKPAPQQGVQPQQTQQVPPVSPYRQQQSQSQPANQQQPAGQNSVYGQQRPVQGQPAMQYIQDTQVQQFKKPKKPDAEILMGIKGMGIVASILVFISFILFAMYLIPGLTDTIKMALMFIISIAMTAVGLFNWLKKKDSLFFLSLGACGIGALYISLFVSNIYFHKIDQIPLYVMLLIWGAGVLYLSKIKPRLFEIIGLSGIVLSVLFGAFSCAQSKDGLMLGILAIYTVIGTLAFMIFRMKDSISVIISNVAAWIGSFIIVMAVITLRSYDITFPAIVIAVFSLLLIVFELVLINEDTYHTLPFFGAGNTALMLLTLRAMLSGGDYIMGLIIIIDIIIYIGVEIYYRHELVNRAPIGAGKSVGVIVWQVFLLCSAAGNILGHDTLNENVGMLMLFVPLVVYGFIKDDLQSKISALILYGILAVELTIEPWLGLVYVIAGCAIYLVMMYIKKGQYSQIQKAIVYVAFLVGLHVWIIALMFEEDWDVEVVFPVLMFITGAINLAAFKTPFGKNWLTGDDEQPFAITTYVINACLMLESIILLYNIDEPFLHAFVVLTTIMLFVINSVRLLKSNETPKVIYVALKFTALLICILSSYDVVNYVISISVFALAIAFILLGFKLQVKSLRIYGLVTTMIFAVKLIMIDIKYDNVLGNAVSFFISGLMCFGISALYSIADKKLAKTNEDHTQMRE